MIITELFSQTHHLFYMPCIPQPVTLHKIFILSLRVDSSLDSLLMQNLQIDHKCFICKDKKDYFKGQWLILEVTIVML